MAYCSNCGVELCDGAKFCSECGTAVNDTSPKQSRRETVYEGEIHKCPNCGEVLNSFVVNCPSCGYELRDVQSSKEIRIFNARLNTFYDRNEKIDFIREYPIPNSKEAIWEFVNLASANIASYDRNGDGTIDKNEQAYIDAWRTLQNRCRDKAKKIYAMDSCEMREIEELIGKSEKTLNQGIRKTANKKVLHTFSSIITTLLKGFWKLIKFLGRLVFDIIKTLWKTTVGKVMLVVLLLVIILIVSNWIDDISNPNSGGLGLPSINSPDIEDIVWADCILGEHIPNPEIAEGDIVTNTTKTLQIHFYDVDRNRITSYINGCKSRGFNIDSKEKELYYKSYNESGYKLTIDYNDYYGYFSIKVDAPIESNEIIWPNSELLNDLPKPPSNSGSISINSSDWFDVYLLNVTYEEYIKYVNECMEAGYNVNYSWSFENTYFTAENKDGTDIRITYEGFNTIGIHLFNVDY